MLIPILVNDLPPPTILLPDGCQRSVDEVLVGMHAWKHLPPHHLVIVAVCYEVLLHRKLLHNMATCGSAPGSGGEAVRGGEYFLLPPLTED